MLIPSLLILFFLSTPIVYSYTVITSAGKRIEGTLITEQASTIMIKDTKGVLISFKKRNLDYDAMARANAPVVHSGPEQRTPATERKAEPGIADFAAQVRKGRTGRARTFTLEDLATAPELSVMGTEASHTHSKTDGDHASDEKRWSSRLESLKKEVHRLRERKISAEASCSDSKRKQFESRTVPRDRPTDLLSTYRESPKCQTLKEVENQLADAEKRLEDAREEGRKAGVSWQTLE